jgi:hypothetical protein
MKKEDEKTAIHALLSGGTVAYHPTFAKALGSIQAGLFLSQAYFWQCKANYAKIKMYEGKRFFERTSGEIYEETGLSIEQQGGAKSKLKELGILEEKRFGLPAKPYLHIDLDALVTVLYRYNETGKQVTVKYRNKGRYSTRTSDGKFRKQLPVNYRDNIETLETPESERETAHAFSVELQPLEDERKNTPHIAPPPPKKESAPTVDDLEAPILEWAHSEQGKPNIYKWYSDAGRTCTRNDVESLITTFCATYSTIGDAGKRLQFMADPLGYFKLRFKVFLKDQPRFERPQAQRHEIGQSSTSSTLPKNLPVFR